jgi:NAD(P)-dependent dehydrogenase (short-subunit alcohol dehydrogenase family)
MTTTQSRNVSQRLQGRRILITGGASGIGLATARLFASEGAALALLDRNGDAAQSVATALGAHAIECDVSDESSVHNAVAAMAQALGGLDGVVNAAGIGGKLSGFGDVTIENWHQTLAVNLTGPFLICREALSHLRIHAGTASIVNIASATGLLPLGFGTSAYAASKGGLITLSKAMAFELAGEVRVNVVCPGAVDTPLLPNSIRDAVATAQSSGSRTRIADAAEIANAILFLVGSESSFITGTAMAVDNGRTFH